MQTRSKVGTSQTRVHPILLAYLESTTTKQALLDP